MTESPNRSTAAQTVSEASPNVKPAHLQDTESDLFVNLQALLESTPTGAHAIVEVDATKDRDPIVPGALRLTGSDFGGEETPVSGRLPLPPHERLTRRLLDAGIGSDTTLLVYAREDTDLGIAARGWVTLRWAGASDARFFNRERGSTLADHAQELSAWIARSKSVGQDRLAPFRVNPGVVATFEDVADRPPEAVLIDARGKDAYESGHIPGALNLPVGDLVHEGSLSDPDIVRSVFETALQRPVEDADLVLSCGSGVSASVQALALASLGIHAPVYIGSWSEWSKRQQ